MKQVNGVRVLQYRLQPWLHVQHTLQPSTVKYYGRLQNSPKTNWQYLILNNTCENTSYILHKAKLSTLINVPKTIQHSYLTFV